MKALKAARIALPLGVAMGAVAGAALHGIYPTFFSGAGELAGVALLAGAATGALAFVLGVLLPEKAAAALGVAPLGAAIAGGVALLRVASVTIAPLAQAAAVGALIAAVVATRPSLAKKSGVIGCVVLFVAALVVAQVRRPPPAAPLDDRPKVVVFGLDAGTWTILDELIAADQLPGLRQLRSDGASGVLRSEVESSSPRVWTSIATGKTPAKHGVVDFFCTQNESLKTRRIWEILHLQEHWSVGLFQWLVTWPPDPFDPFVVPAWMARGPETHPSELSFIKELELAFQTGEFDQWRKDREWSRLFTKLRDWGKGYVAHGLRFPTALAAARQAITAMSDPSWERQYAAKRTLQLLLNGDVYLELYRRHRPDFSCFICYGTDNLAHKFWQYHYPDDFAIAHADAAPFATLLTDYYRACDALLVELLPLLSRNTTVAVLSDHGFTSKGEGGESRQRELRPKMSRIADELDLEEKDVLWSAVATRGYFRPVAGSPGAMEATKRIVEFLTKCEVIGGPKVFVVKLLESGQIEVAVNSDSGLERDTPVATPLGTRLFGDLVDVEDRTGNHSIDGIVLLRGPAIRRGARLEQARLVDITPTLLHLHGLAVGADMDGRVIEEALTDDFRATHAIERIASWDDLVEVTRQAAGPGDERAWRKYASELGYVDGGKDGR
jgi:predicted AlkP superfamily pyrophosphatase or phosphodiesterase